MKKSKPPFWQRLWNWITGKPKVEDKKTCIHCGAVREYPPPVVGRWICDSCHAVSW